MNSDGSIFQPREPTQAEVEDLICRTNLFFRDVLRNKTDDETVQAENMYIEWSFTEGAAQPVQVSFGTNATSESGRIGELEVYTHLQLSEQEILTYITEYVFSTQPDSEFQKVDSVNFTSTADEAVPLGTIESVDCPETPAPTNMPSPAPTGTVTTLPINSAFVVSNIDGITSPDEVRAKGLDATWPSFATQTITDITTARGKDAVRRLLRQGGYDDRRLAVGYESDSAQIDTVTERICPEGVEAHPDAVCHDVTASYVLRVRDEDNVALESDYREDTNTSIYDGTYQNMLDTYQNNLDGESNGSPIYIGVFPPDGSLYPPSNETAPTAPVTSAPSSSTPTKCAACDSSIVETNTLPGGLPCSFWRIEASLLDVDSEACLLERAVGATYCGCFKDQPNQRCELCPDSTFDQRLELPDALGLTCASLQGLLTIDGTTTCEVLSTKYAAWCGCEETVDPSCSFCESGRPALEGKPYILPSLDEAQLTYRVFGHMGNSSCGNLADFYAVQTDRSCPNVDGELLSNISFDARAWCECPGTVPARACGDFCGSGKVLLETYLNCKDLSDMFPYISDESSCSDYEDQAKLCCITPPVTVNASFVVYNEKKLQAEDLVKLDSARTLNTAFKEFVVSIVTDMPSQSRRRFLSESMASYQRRLTVSLRPDGSRINGVLTVGCPRNATIPDGAICHNVYGTYDLVVENEEREAVPERFEAALGNAIQNGKLQEKLDEIDPDYPFVIVGLIADDAVEDEPDSGMEWWEILFIVLGCIFGCCGLCCIWAYFASRPQKDNAIGEDDEIRAPLTEASAQLHGSETSSKNRTVVTEENQEAEANGSTAETRSMAAVEDDGKDAALEAYQRAMDSGEMGDANGEDPWEDDPWEDNSQQTPPEPEGTRRTASGFDWDEAQMLRESQSRPGSGPGLDDSQDVAEPPMARAGSGFSFGDYQEMVLARQAAIDAEKENEQQVAEPPMTRADSGFSFGEYQEKFLARQSVLDAEKQNAAAAEDEWNDEDVQAPPPPPPMLYTEGDDQEWEDEDAGEPEMKRAPKVDVETVLSTQEPEVPAHHVETVQDNERIPYFERTSLVRDAVPDLNNYYDDEHDEYSLPLDHPLGDLQMEQTRNTENLLGVEHADNTNKLEQINAVKQNDEIMHNSSSWLNNNDDTDDDEGVGDANGGDGDSNYSSGQEPRQPPPQEPQYEDYYNGQAQHEQQQ